MFAIFHNILGVARYESKMLLRTTKFRILGMDLTRFGGYLISNQKGAPLCHQHVRLIHLS